MFQFVYVDEPLNPIDCDSQVYSASPAFTIAAEPQSPAQFQYPPAPTNDQVDDYNGVKVADPYRPLENPDAPESRKWIEAENKITFDFLGTIPGREAIKKRITELWDYEKFGVPFKQKERYFISREDSERQFQ